jgi:hypothetical protein
LNLPDPAPAARIARPLRAEKGAQAAPNIALGTVLRLAKSAAADDLPGWCGPIS